MSNCTTCPPGLPQIIQGGMGIGVSNWKLARAISRAQQLGVVSGTALTSVLVRRLQDGDHDGSMRHALARFPYPTVARAVLARYFRDGGKAETEPYRLAPLYSLPLSAELVDLTILANFVEVFLAKEGHDGVVGINLLEKVQLPTLPSLFGAMLAGVDYVLMGAGIPRSIPGMLDRLSRWEPAELGVAVEGASAERNHRVEFDPEQWSKGQRVPLRRPSFLAIVSSSTLALTLARKSNGRVDGFVVEGVTAGGHNAPPRGGGELNARGEPVYGPRDQPDLKAIRALGLPFWLAGGYGLAGRLQDALEAGAAGIQVGTAFAFCEESGLRTDLKEAILSRSQAGQGRVLTDPRASPTGMPFKVIELEGTLSEDDVYRQRTRVCDLGYLRRPYERPDGSIGYRCAGEPESDYVRKGGRAEDTEGRKCLCNGLLAAVALEQTRTTGEVEPTILTGGDEIASLSDYLPTGQTTYRADDVLRVLMGKR